MLAFPKPGMMMTGEPSISAKVRSDARRGANITLRSDVGCIAAAVAAAAMRWNIVGARTGYAMNTHTLLLISLISDDAHTSLNGLRAIIGVL